MIYAAPALGFVLLLLLLWDVLITVFHPEGHGGPVHRALSRSVWGAFRVASLTRGGTVRRNMASMAGPLVAMLTPVTWITLVVLAFALIYLPWIDELLDPQQLGASTWLESLFHSLNAASTLGMGSLTADHIFLRILTAVEGLASFALLTAALTYIMAVYRQISTMQTLALEIHTRLPDPTEVPPCDEPQEQQEWEQWLARTARVLLGVRQAFAQYPIVHYFRPRRTRDALLLQIDRLLQFGEALREADHPLTRRPAVHAVEHALHAYLTALHDQLLGRTSAAGDQGASSETARRMQQEVLDYFMLGGD